MICHLFGDRRNREAVRRRPSTRAPDPPLESKIYTYHGTTRTVAQPEGIRRAVVAGTGLGQTWRRHRPRLLEFRSLSTAEFGHPRHARGLTPHCQHAPISGAVAGFTHARCRRNAVLASAGAGWSSAWWSSAWAFFASRAQRPRPTTDMHDSGTCAYAHACTHRAAL